MLANGCWIIIPDKKYQLLYFKPTQISRNSNVREKLWQKSGIIAVNVVMTGISVA